MKDSDPPSEVTCQLGDLGPGARFIMGTDDFLVTNRTHDDEGKTWVVSLTTGLMKSLPNSARLVATNDRRHKLCSSTSRVTMPATPTPEKEGTYEPK